jgi:hypothetical protein
MMTCCWLPGSSQPCCGEKKARTLELLADHWVVSLAEEESESVT